MRDDGSVNQPLADRAGLAGARRVVVKVGSSSLTAADGRLSLPALHTLVEILAARGRRGQQIVLVSSGAIAAGITPLGLPAKPKDLATAQATASVGQGILVARYTEAFTYYGQQVGQVLLTAEDLIRRTNYANAQRALERLLTLGVVPIVNENDTVATDEIRFGDNDRLAALVSHLVRADALVLLTDVEGLYDGPPSDGGARLVRAVTSPADLAGVEVTARGSDIGTGGMVTKLDAASIATGAGIPVVLTSAALARPALEGEDVGTWFAATGKRKSARRLWLAHAAQVRGRLHIDAGAARAVTDGKRSLLAAGVVGVDGDFEPGDVVELVGPEGVVARGLVAYGSGEVPRMMGKSTDQLRGAGHDDHPRAVVHRDDLAQVRVRTRARAGR
ncbi:glutamate 5-kinase [Georgenia sp. TF02-10]|uniref:glutamate 5-kinase n=1 Tax=Georgenia sp. TF02-10 TaxID=2917725 RepID=UPI001FA7DEDE|nr:glutamate 5-kinase [Georgenia sp. TF02-10]UNX53819.1 glutamate 5-kinase [Georgenia sp. TF02-10]